MTASSNASPPERPDALPVVLVVDDIAANRNLLRSMLESAGYEVLLATGGEMAVKVARLNRPDIVLLDLMMPGVDGFEACRRLKQDPVTKETPVIFITANKDEDSLVEGFRVGAVDFVAKPFRQEEVLVRLDTQRKIHRLTRSLADKNEQLQSALRTTEEARQRSDELLHVILPHEIAEELKQTHQVRPRRLESVGVLFCDIVGFTTYCDEHEAAEVHAHLQHLVERFEEIAAGHGLEKIKTIGDCFMAAVVPSTAETNPALTAVRCGLALIDAARTQPPYWTVRVGIHVGPVIAGVVGHRKYQYDMWGDTVNLASRLQQSAKPGTVCVTADIWPSVASHCCEHMSGDTAIKGKGQIQLHWIEPGPAANVPPSDVKRHAVS